MTQEQIDKIINDPNYIKGVKYLSRIYLLAGIMLQWWDEVDGCWRKAGILRHETKYHFNNIERALNLFEVNVRAYCSDLKKVMEQHEHIEAALDKYFSLKGE